MRKAGDWRLRRAELLVFQQEEFGIKIDKNEMKSSFQVQTPVRVKWSEV